MKNTFIAEWLADSHPQFVNWLAEKTVTLAPDGEQFILASGQKSDYYLDLKSVLMDPYFIGLMAQGFYHMLCHEPEENPYLLISGMETAAIPLVSMVCTYNTIIGSVHEPAMSGFYLRKGEKTHGTKRRIEWKGDLTGQRVAILEDVVTTGGSSLEAVKLLREAGAVVEDVFCVVDREAGGEAAFEAEGVKLHTIFFGRDLLEAAKAA